MFFKLFEHYYIPTFDNDDKTLKTYANNVTIAVNIKLYLKVDQRVAVYL